MYRSAWIMFLVFGVSWSHTHGRQMQSYTSAPKNQEKKTTDIPICAEYVAKDGKEEFCKYQTNQRTCPMTCSNRPNEITPAQDQQSCSNILMSLSEKAALCAISSIRVKCPVSCSGVGSTRHNVAPGSTKVPDHRGKDEAHCKSSSSSMSKSAFCNNNPQNRVSCPGICTGVDRTTTTLASTIPLTENSFCPYWVGKMGRIGFCNYKPNNRVSCPISCKGVRKTASNSTPSKVIDNASCGSGVHRMGTFAYCNYSPQNRKACPITCNGVSTTVENYTGTDGDGQQCKDYSVNGVEAFCEYSANNRKVCPITCKIRKTASNSTPPKVIENASCGSGVHRMGTFAYCNYSPQNRKACSITCNGVSTTVENYTGTDGDGQQCKDYSVNGVEAFCDYSANNRKVCPITCRIRKTASNSTPPKVIENASCGSGVHRMGTFAYCNYSPQNRKACPITCNGVSTTVENYTGTDGDGQQCKDYSVNGVEAFCEYSANNRKVCPITCKMYKG